jgi:lysophospholipase L1-like esterase
VTDDRDASVPRVMRSTAPPPPSPDMIRLVETLLDKRPVDPELQARLSDPGAQAARLEREARERADDWAGLSRYRAANANVRRPELVMIGDSLTEIWQLAIPEMFGAAIVNRGIAGQTSPQILLRFMQDVVDLEPRAVHILCGTNDIAGNTGPNLPEEYLRNIRAMVQIATANGIDVLLGSIPPTASIFWQPEARPLDWIPRLNAWLHDFAAERVLRFIDYHAALVDGTGGLQERYSADGVHVSRTAYRLMRQMLSRSD